MNFTPQGVSLAKRRVCILWFSIDLCCTKLVTTSDFWLCVLYCQKLKCVSRVFAFKKWILEIICKVCWSVVIEISALAIYSRDIWVLSCTVTQRETLYKSPPAEITMLRLISLLLSPWCLLIYCCKSERRMYLKPIFLLALCLMFTVCEHVANKS
jgi:hypothetical protein